MTNAGEGISQDLPLPRPYGRIAAPYHHFAVTPPGPIKLFGDDDLQPGLAQPAITKGSRTNRPDALPGYYKTNSFKAQVCFQIAPGAWKGWERAIGQHNRQYI